MGKLSTVEGDYVVLDHVIGRSLFSCFDLGMGVPCMMSLMDPTAAGYTHQ